MRTGPDPLPDKRSCRGASTELFEHYSRPVFCTIWAEQEGVTSLLVRATHSVSEDAEPEVVPLPRMSLLFRARYLAAPSRLHSGRPRSLWVILALLCLPTTALAQEGTAILAGRILDVTDEAPIGFVSVVVENVDSGEQVTGTLTGEEGRFLVQGLPPGQYRVGTSFPGFYPAAIEVFVGELNQSFDLGDIRLDRLETFEEEVTVTAEVIRAAGLDTQVFSLDDGAALSTGSLLDAMRNLPGVTVDQEGMVSLRGSDRVAILIDGRQSSLTGFGSQRGLDSVSAANVEAIEIINNPSARFDAAGMAGIINVIYRQEQQLGFSGDVGLSTGLGQFSRQRADLPTDLGSFANNPKIIPSLNLNHNTETVRSFFQGELESEDAISRNPGARSRRGSHDGQRSNTGSDTRYGRLEDLVP